MKNRKSNFGVFFHKNIANFEAFWRCLSGFEPPEDRKPSIVLCTVQVQVKVKVIDYKNSRSHNNSYILGSLQLWSGGLYSASSIIFGTIFLRGKVGRVFFSASTGLLMLVFVFVVRCFEIKMRKTTYQLLQLLCVWSLSVVLTSSY